MHLLVLANDLGRTAPGIVYETILREMCIKSEVSLITVEGSSVEYDGICLLPNAKKFKEKRWMENMQISLFGRSLYDDFWLFRQKRLIDSETVGKQDVIVSFASNHNFKSIILGHYLSRRYGKPWVIYLVDAVPAPIGWLKSKRLHNSTKRFIRRYIKSADALFSSNGQMLEYQLSDISFDKPKGVLYTPIRSMSPVMCDTGNGADPYLLYTGGLYGARKPELLVEAFRKLLERYPKCKLVFVGIGDYNLENCNDLIEAGKIEIHGYVKDLTPFYEKATVLLDLNSYFDNDIFLSSKIVNYLPINRPIVSITGLNSPSRNIFTEDPSILHCRYDASEICLALEQSIENNTVNRVSRQHYLTIFSAESNVDRFLKALSGVCSCFGE